VKDRFAEERAYFCDPALERTVLSACMKNTNVLLAVQSKAKVTDFLENSHREFFKVLVSLYDQEVRSFDPVTVITEAKMSRRLEKIHGGDEEYIYTTYEIGERHIENINVYINKLLDISKKFQTYIKLVSIEEEIKFNKDPVEENKSAYELISKAENELMNLGYEGFVPDEPMNMADGIDEWFQEKLDNPVRLTGIPTGFRRLDERIDGLVPGTLNIVAARRKRGKSALLMNMAANIAYKPPFPAVLVIDTEMSTVDEWRPRLISHISKIEERKIIHGNLDEKEKRTVQIAIDLIKKGKLFHQYTPGFTVEKVISLFKMYRQKENIAVGIFDYIKMPGDADVRSLKEYQILGDITTKLKDIAGILRIPILCAVQVSREGRVADSDKIERYADVLMEFTFRTDEEVQKTGGDPKYGKYKLVVRASRRGGELPECGIGLKFKKKILTIEEATEQMLDNMDWEIDEEDITYQNDDVVEENEKEDVVVPKGMF
jgi:replicative DNA helicase